MRPILPLAAWNWRMARRPYGILCAVFAVQQLAVLLFQTQVPDQQGAGLARYYEKGWQFELFLAFFLLAGLLAGPAINDQKRAKCSYTWLTMPLSPAARLAGQVMTAAVLQLGFVALQLVLYVLYFFPVQVMENAVVMQQTGQQIPPTTLYEQLIMNRGFYWLIPRRPEHTAMLVFTLLAAALLLTAVRLHKGWRRAVAFLIGVVCGGACMVILQVEQLQAQHDEAFLEGVIRPSISAFLALLTVLLVFSVWWALRAIRRAEAA